ncbi:protein TEX261-like [Dendronephthya gigantea]|uniref:protein TEX261-like n=1 Tax=Dendronephthya gigantea TaxID=151771 RepID=UPI0010695C27|nr:protein TEX261-like [Dendronephthya gigantea]
MFLYLLSWFATCIQILFVTVALASALYYLAELVEEYTVIAGRMIKIMIGVVTVAYVGLLLFESFPWYIVALGLATNVVYFLLLNDFPYISFTSPVFLLSVVLVFVNHYLAFQFFSQVYYAFSEILGYFTVCLWILPFAFFVSLSANDNVLPTASMQQGPNTDYTYVGQSSSKRQGILAIFDFIYSQLQNIFPTRSVKSF